MSHKVNVIEQLKELELHGMLACYEELVSQHGSKESHEWLLKHLIQAESTDRVVRSIAYQMKAARFPIHCSLLDFDFKQAKVDETLIDELGTFDFTKSASNVVLVDGTVTGKTHLATGLGVKVIGQYGKRVRFYSTVDLVNQLEIEKAAGK